MDYFTSDTKPTDTITDKINVYGNKGSFKHLYQRNEDGSEEEIKSLQDIDKSIVGTAWLPAAIAPPIFTFSIPPEQSYDQGRLRKMLYNLCENTSISCVIWDAEDINHVTAQPSINFPLNGNIIEFSKPDECTKQVFNRASNNDVIRAQDTDVFIFYSTNNYVNLKKTLKINIKGTLLFQNTEETPSIIEVYPASPINPLLKSIIMPTGGWIEIPGKKTGETLYSGYHDFNFDFLMSFPNETNDRIRIYWRELTTLANPNISCKIKTLMVSVINIGGSNVQNV